MFVYRTSNVKHIQQHSLIILRSFFYVLPTTGITTELCLWDVDGTYKREQTSSSTSDEVIHFYMRFHLLVHNVQHRQTSLKWFMSSVLRADWHVWLEFFNYFHIMKCMRVQMNECVRLLLHCSLFAWQLLALNVLNQILQNSVKLKNKRYRTKGINSMGFSHLPANTIKRNCYSQNFHDKFSNFAFPSYSQRLHLGNCNCIRDN